MLGKAGLYVTMNGTLVRLGVSRLCSFKASFLGISLALAIWLLTKRFLKPRFVNTLWHQPTK